VLSKAEIEYLRNPEQFGANYAKVLRHRVKGKMQALQEEINLLQSVGLVTQNCNQVTESCNPNQAAFGKMELGMGIEPTYSSSAGCRLNRSATPARMTLS
jgi:hypothetical protein